MSIRVVNNFHVTLAAGAAIDATSLTLSPGAGNSLRTKLTGSSSTAMAGGDYLYLTLFNTAGDIEIVKMTALPSSGDTCTVTRAQDGTAARAWSAGDGVAARPCAAFFVDALALLGTTAAAVSYNNATTGLAAATVQAAIDLLGTPIGAALAGLDSTAGLVEQTGPDAFTKTPITAFAKTLLDDANAATARATLGAAPAFVAGAVGEIGRYLDFHGTDNATDYDARLECGPGTGTTGGGTFNILAAAMAFNGLPMFACRAWVNFNGTGAVAIRASGNVSSITDNGVGDYTVNFTTAMPDANYAVSLSGPQLGTGTGSNISIGIRTSSAAGSDPSTSISTTSVRIMTRVGINGDAIDSDFFSVAIFR